MYIEFSLPNGAAGQAAGHANMIVNNELVLWSQKYQIPYTTKIVKYIKRVTFEQDEHYSLFAMTWNPAQKFYALGRWRIVSDLNNKIEFDSRV
jgi:hypothetical protein